MSDSPSSEKPSNASKSCSICGIDVSNAPRTKDATGKYICTQCLEKAKTTAAVLKNPPKPVPVAAKPRDDDDNTFLLNLGTQTQALHGGKECPKCDRVLNQTDQVCIGCGYSFDAGRAVPTKVVRAASEKGAGKKSPAHIAIAVVVLAGLAYGAYTAFYS